MGVRIIGTGSYLPENIVFNKEIELTSSYDPIKKGRSLDKWARHYHGGIMRHVVKSGEGASDLALKASQEAINSASLKPRDIDLIVMSTFTGDHRLPQTAGQVQAEINPDAKFIQIDAACSGFIDGALVACSLLEVFKYKNCLLVGVDVPSFLCDPKDYLARSVFGDGAGAVVLRKSSDQYGFKSFHTGSDGNIGDYVFVPAGGSKMPFNQTVLDRGDNYWTLNFSQITPWALKRFITGSIEALRKAGIEQSDIDWVVPHQASCKIIKTFSQQMEIPPEKYMIFFDRHGNLCSASVPVALDCCCRTNTFKRGDWILIPTVGAGMAWGTATYLWG